MSEFGERTQPPSADRPGVERIADIFGGPKVLKRKLKDPLDAHELLLRGLPGAALTHLVGRLPLLRDPAALQSAFGMTLRTLQRHKVNPAKPLSPQQSGRAWKFAEILARVTAALGSGVAAEEWFERPAIGLNRRRPIELLSTPAGVEMVESYLTRIEYGVYT